MTPEMRLQLILALLEMDIHPTTAAIYAEKIENYIMNGATKA